MLLDIARTEGLQTPLGLDRLETSKEAWGWDSTDLAWEARIIRWGRGARSLRGGARADLDSVAETSLGRAAMTLGRPVSASIIDGRMGCAAGAAVNQAAGEEAEELARSAAPLHPYRALGIGYSRGEAQAEPVGRIVFAYRSARQASKALAGRRLIMDEGFPWPDSPRSGTYADIAFSVIDAEADGRELIFDVAPVGGFPPNLYKGMIRGASFMTCGPIPDKLVDVAIVGVAPLEAAADRHRGHDVVSGLPVVPARVARL